MVVAAPRGNVHVCACMLPCLVQKKKRCKQCIVLDVCQSAHFHQASTLILCKAILPVNYAEEFGEMGSHSFSCWGGTCPLFTKYFSSGALEDGQKWGDMTRPGIKGWLS